MSETTDNLNVQIALALGWAEMRVEEWNDCTPGAEDNSYTRDFLTGVEAHSTIRQPVPDYAGSLDAVMSANTAPNASLNVSKMPNGWLADINVYDSDRVFDGRGASAAEAAARALLFWLTAQQKQEAGE